MHQTLNSARVCQSSKMNTIFEKKLIKSIAKSWPISHHLSPEIFFYQLSEDFIDGYLSSQVCPALGSRADQTSLTLEDGGYKIQLYSPLSQPGCSLKIIKQYVNKIIKFWADEYFWFFLYFFQLQSKIHIFKLKYVFNN